MLAQVQVEAYMNFTVVRALIALMLASWALLSQAVTYGPSLNEAEWRLKMSPFECRLWQPIPAFGDAVFHHKAGEEQVFYLAPVANPMRDGSASMISNAPVWDDSKPTENMGYVPVRGEETPIALGRQYAYQLLNELYAGMSPEFTRRSWFAEGETVKVFMSSVNFRKAYTQYQGCLANLLPVNFEQIQSTRVHFDTAKWNLTRVSKARLDNIVRYVKADPSVTSFYIDGHTDNVGRRLYNLDLSKKRAEAVASYLISQGVGADLITTRYHGERYPLVPSNSVQARAENRRVTLRLGREGV